MKRVLILVLLITSWGARAQLLTWSPAFPKETDSDVAITMDASFGNKGLLGYDVNDVFVHIGCITSLSTGSSDWKYVKSTWGSTNTTFKALPVSGQPNKWVYTIAGNLRSFYGITNPNEKIIRIAILFRSGNGSKKQANADGSDMYVPVYETGLQVALTNPFRQPTYVATPENISKTVGQTIDLAARSSENANMRLLFNGTLVNSQSGTTSIAATPTIASAGSQRIIAEADNGSTVKRDTIDFYIAPTTEIAALPPGVTDGINYNPNGTEVTLVLYAPNKNNIVVIGDFNNWTAQSNFQMKRTPDNLRYWLTISGLTSGQEYAYQYLIDGTLKVADYNCEKVLDPWNDQYINQGTYTDIYPNLKPYPTGLTTGIVSVLQPGKPAYNWSQATLNFQRPDKRNLVVYEMLVRDFVQRNDWKGAIDSLDYLAELGVNAIHVMPWTEFEGNISWGYNPAFMFAADKAYGPDTRLKDFVEACHARGIAVIMDMVLNHQFGSSPMVQMYWDAAQSKPAANSPWFNQDAKHPFNVGYDMNHESTATADFVQRVMRHWLVNYKIDGFRWDLSKGFTQVFNTDAGAWSNYDQSRVNIWQRIYNQSQTISTNCYMILEHLGVDQEEATLANMGMLLWGKMTNEFNEASMGYLPGSNFERTWHTKRWESYGGGNTPHLMAYAESHDEERLSYKNRNFGNSTNPAHNVKSLGVYAKRQESIAAFLFTIPGPKLIWQFGELAYDSSINMCNTLQNAGCRVDPKPSAFRMPALPNFSPSQPFTGPYYNYNFVQENDVNVRVDLRNRYRRIISLRTKNASYLPTFTTSNVAFNVSGSVKWQWASTASLGLTTVGNFDVVSQSGTVNFPSTGTWYVYEQNVGAGSSLTSVNGNFSANGSSINVTSTSMTFNLPPGTFIILTDRQVPAAVTSYTFTGNGNWSNAANWAGGMVPPLPILSGVTVTINPPADGEAVIDVPVSFRNGAILIVAPGKKLRINGNLFRQ